MKSKQFGRRQFLVGAASTLGAGMLTGLPQLARSKTQPIGTSLKVGLLYWTGGKFIPADQIATNPISSQSVSVRIEAFGQNHGIAAIDIVMPGGLFHAFTSPPQGLKVAQFNSPLSSGSLLMNAIIGDSEVAIALRSYGPSGFKLAEGTYLLTQDPINGLGIILTDSADMPVQTVEGQPLSVSHITLTIAHL